MADQKKAYLYALLAVLAWSTVATAFKISLRYLTFLELLLYSSLFSALVLAGVLVVGGRLRDLRSCTRRDYLSSAGLGLLNPFAYYLVLFKAYSLVPAQIAQSLNYTWAVVIVVFSIIFLGQKITLGRVAAILVSYLGVIVIATRGRFRDFGPANPLGVVLALGSALIWATYWLVNLRDRRDAAVKLFLNFVFGFLFALAASAAFALPRRPDLRGLAGAAYIGTFEMGVTFVLWLKALKLSRTTAQVSNLIFLAPFLSLVLINFVLRERVVLPTILGLVLIVAGIFMQQLKKKDRDALTKP
jgi:drug/metabolite transporter (DMT)-like permease